MKYYTNDEIIDALAWMAESCPNSVDTGYLEAAIERIKSQEQQRQYMSQRMRVAAEHIGFSTIDELMSYE